MWPAPAGDPDHCIATGLDRAGPAGAIGIAEQGPAALDAAMSEAPLADQAAIARVGASVRARLATDPSVHRIAAERVEMFAVQQFLSPAECDHIKAMIDAVARPSSMFAGYGEEADRTSFSGDVDPGDNFVRMIERRICDLMGMKQEWGETFQGQRYEPGQEFRGHYDYFNTETEYWPR